LLALAPAAAETIPVTAQMEVLAAAAAAQGVLLQMASAQPPDMAVAAGILALVLAELADSEAVAALAMEITAVIRAAVLLQFRSGDIPALRVAAADLQVAAAAAVC
jgi:hypothetical protein